MQPSVPSAKSDVPPSARDYEKAVDELLQLYTGIDKVALALQFVVSPMFSPAAQVAKNRNPQSNWRMGELGYIPVLSLRPLFLGMLHWHFCNRLSALRQNILLETRFSENGAKATLARIDRATDFWKQRLTLGFILFTWVLPLSGPIIAAWKWLFPNSFLAPPSSIAWTFGLLSLTYVLIFLITAFLTKRGLMLGGRDYAVYFPSSVSGEGAYAQEREILGPLGLASSEFPLDAMLLLLAWALLFIVYFGIEGRGLSNRIYSLVSPWRPSFLPCSLGSTYSSSCVAGRNWAAPKMLREPTGRR